MTVYETSLADLRIAMEQKRITSREIATRYLARIATYDTRLYAAIAVNPRALDEADARDRERAAGRVRGPLHGIPVALKDNIHTTEMPTTGRPIVSRKARHASAGHGGHRPRLCVDAPDYVRVPYSALLSGCLGS